MSAKELSDKQKRFAEEYCVDQNATQAALRAGYAPKYAGRQAYKLVENSRLQAAIAKRMEEIAKVHDITREELVSGYRNLSLADIADYAKWDDDKVKWKSSDELTKEQTLRIKEISESYSMKGQRSFKIVLHDRKGGLDGLAKISGNFVERREHSGLGGKAIEHTHKGIEIDLQKLTPDEIRQLREITEKAKRDKDSKNDLPPFVDTRTASAKQ